MIGFTQLTTLESAGLMTLVSSEPELLYGFHHALVQEAVYSSLMNRDKRLLHQAVGEVMEQTYPERLEEMAPILAEHFLQAGDTGRSRRYLVMAGDAAKKIYANPEAELHYRKALEPLIHEAEFDEAGLEILHQLYENLGRVLELQGHYEAAVVHYREMERLAIRLGDRALELAALMACATIQSTPTSVFNPSQAQINSDRALAISRQINDPMSEAKINWILMLLYSLTNRTGESRVYGLRSLELARELGLIEQAAYTLNDMASFVYFPDGELDEALANYNEAQVLWRETGNLHMLTDNLSGAAFVDVFKGDFDQAIELATEALQISEKISNIWGKAYSLGIIGIIMAIRGQVSQAIANMDKAFQLSDEVGFGGLKVIGGSIMAVLFASLGEDRTGFLLEQEAMASGFAASAHWKPQILGSIAIQHILRSELDQARDVLRQAHAAGAEDEVPYRYRFVATAESELYLATGEYESLRDHARKTREARERTGANAFVPETFYYEGKALIELGQCEEARSILKAGLAQAESMGLIILKWQMFSALYDLESGDSGQDSAVKTLRQARNALQLVVEQIDDEDLKRTFLSKEEVRKISEGG